LTTVNTREIVLNILMEVLENKQYSHLIINSVLDKFMYLGKSERGFIKMLSEGTIESAIELDYIINLYSKTPVKKMKPEIRNILRLSVYQILHMNSVPDHSACDEAVKLTIKTKKYRNLKGFVNGVLRSICRNKDDITYPSPEIKYSLPEWIANQWKEQYGEATYIKMVESLGQESPVIIRPRYDISKDELIKSLNDEGVSTRPAPYVDKALEIYGFDSINEIKAFQRGEFYIQDISSMLVGLIANPKEEDTCLDVCAAPGGKSLHLAELMHNTGKVLARDVSENKVDLLTQNFIRSGLTNIEAECFDATVLDDSQIEANDIVLCDLPCSGLGIIRRKSDIKYNMNLNMQDELVELQRKILAVASKYVKLNGSLIYSTCTTNKKENIENVRWFLEEFPFEPESIDEFLPDELKSDKTAAGYIEILPGIFQCDGFFIARLKRI